MSVTTPSDASSLEAETDAISIDLALTFATRATQGEGGTSRRSGIRSGERSIRRKSGQATRRTPSPPASAQHLRSPLRGPLPDLVVARRRVCLGDLGRTGGWEMESLSATTREGWRNEL